MTDPEPPAFLDDATHGRERQYATLVELALLAMSQPSLETVLNEVAARLREALGCDYTKILDQRASATGLLVRGGSGWPQGVVGHREVPDDGNDSQAAFTLRSGEPVIVQDMLLEERFVPPALLSDHGVRSGIAVVIGGSPDDYGVLEADSKQPDFFHPGDVPLMDAFARLLSEVIHQHEREDANANFAAIASHEMRTPLTSIVGFSRRLLRRLDNTGQITPAEREELEFVVEESARLQRSIELFLALGEIERRTLTIDRREVDLPEVIESATEAVAQLYPTTRFIAELDTDDLVVEADPLPLGRILSNLLENGAKNSPPTSEVHLRVRRDDDAVTFEVTDECGGISDDDMRHLFERAFRGSRDSGRGLGIGLYVALRLAEHLGGSISAENRPPEGCAFELRLPIATAGDGDRPATATE